MRAKTIKSILQKKHYEYKSCGYHRTEAYGKRLTEYREGINAEGEG